MKQNARMLRVLAAVLLTIGLTSCESATVSQPDDSSAQFSSANGRSKAGRQVARVSAESGTAYGDANNGHGAVLSVAGHTLFVPAGAVRQSTDFVMSVEPGPYFGVELTATKRGSRATNDVGARGFVEPLTLCIDRSDAAITDPTKVSIAEMVNGRFLKVPTTITESHVCGSLRHFSGYTMIED